jgi:hypothetical protein
MVARGAAKPLTKKELELCTVRQLMEVARRAGAVVPLGTTKQPLIDLLVKAKVTGTHLADPADSSDASDGSNDDSDGSHAGSDSSNSSAHDHHVARKIPISHAIATSKKPKKSKKHNDSDSDDDDTDEEDEDSPYAVISRHTGYSHSHSSTHTKKLGRDGRGPFADFVDLHVCDTPRKIHRTAQDRVVATRQPVPRCGLDAGDAFP